LKKEILLLCNFIIKLGLGNDENPPPGASFVGIVFPLIPVSRKLSLSGDFET
jgi:hypothetical protein